MSKSNWLPLIIGGAVLIVLAFIGGRMLYFGSGTGTYTPPERELLPANIEAAAVPPKPALTVTTAMTSGEVLDASAVATSGVSPPKIATARL